MNLTIYTYGHIDSMFYALNGLAMLLNHKDFGVMLLESIAVISASYYAVKIAYAANSDYRNYIGKILGMVAMIYVFLIPRTDVLIYDHVSKKKEKVDNLPVGFALPVGALEAFGDALTGGFEQAFGQVGNTSYRDYGMVFGARLVQEARNWRIKSPEFVENMSNFIDRCVITEAMIGYYYSPEELLTTDNIWQLVKSNAGTIRQVVMRVGKNKRMMSCKEAANDVIEHAFRFETEMLEKLYAKTEFGGAGYSREVGMRFIRIGSNLKRNIEMSFNNYLGTNMTGEELIRQQMMISSIGNYADEYGYARASTTQESNWMIAGRLAGIYVPILLTVLKVLVYSSFIFLFPLLLISGGFSRYIGYLTLVASLQLWAPLNAVLNMFIDIYSSDSLKDIAGSIVSFSTMSRAGNYTDKIVTVASGLQMAIPFLAFSIVQGGVSGFIHLAGNITGASTTAAASAANESVTGNKSFDNYSVGNKQLYNQSGFKTDWNQSYASGASSYQHMDGSLEKVTGAGNALIQSGVGFTASSGATSYHLEDSRYGQVTQGIQNAESLHEQDVRSYSEAKSNTYAKASDYISHLAKREHRGESFNYDSMGEQGKTLQQAIGYTKQLHDKKGYSWEQAARASAEASLTLSTPLQKVVGFGFSGTAGASVNATNSSNQSVEEADIINRDNNTSTSYSNLIKAASNSSWARENSIDTSYSDSIRDSYEEQKRAEAAVSISKQKVDDWHKAKTVIDSQGASSRRDMYQEVVEGIKQDYGTDVYSAQKMADSQSPEARKVWKQLQNQDNYVENLVNDIAREKSATTGDEGSQRLDHLNLINKNTESRVRTVAANNDMEIDTFKGNLLQQRDTIKQQHNDITSENAIQHNAVKHHNEAEARDLESQTKKYEEDRIGKGSIAKGSAWILDKVTNGYAGGSIGKPDKDASKIHKGAYENAEQVKPPSKK